jgi:enamine deaminase RidA (YjgF/YER057c/UK114 family)
MELIINKTTTIEEYEAWLSHPDTTIAMMREDSAKWSALIDQSFERIDAILDDMKSGIEQKVSMELLLYVVEQEKSMEEVINQAREVLYVAPRSTTRPYDISDDSFQFEVDLIDKLEAKKLRSRIKNALVKVASLIGVGLMVIHNLL